MATFVGLAVSKLLPIGSGARGQITFSMILVVALGPTSGYAAARLLDCAIGGAVGILVALLVPEPPQIEPVRTRSSLVCSTCFILTTCAFLSTLMA